ncbi:tryptophan 7-halogenase [Bartonella sp. HY038]|uniref:tryptophan 7-halogenase n=1 Tax=Bartonella sp. HY038 TaxID=2759660 RepID=UPI0015F7E1A6|nr:tryptophan 7-halogenase [Bartonella sp. HY038]
MLDLRSIKKVAVIGGDIAAWLAALTFRRQFGPLVEITVFDDETQPIADMCEGGLVNLLSTLQRNQIQMDEFYSTVDATFKIGTKFENWRSNGENEAYYHLLPKKDANVPELTLEAFGTNPLLISRIASLQNLHDFFPGFKLIQQNASQYDAAAELQTANTGLALSFHFDRYKFKNFLKSKALNRNIKQSAIEVRQLLLSENGNVAAIKIDEAILPTDFVIDASGVKRLGIGATYGQNWRSFSDQLINDKAVTFSLQQKSKNPQFFTTARAMKSGWIWQSPLRQYVGAGYVFSSRHSSADHAADEIEALFGNSVTFEGVLNFNQGNFERIWCNNLIALGAAAGFVEPLEAASIGQSLETLRNIERIINNCRGVIGQNIIDGFNIANNQSWNEICDFLRLHYDTPRDDTAYWRDVQYLPRSPQYQEFSACCAQRVPRVIDIEAYTSNSWLPIFHIINWLLVAAPLGIINPHAARAELETLPEDFIKQHIQPYLSRLQNGKNN